MSEKLKLVRRRRRYKRTAFDQQPNMGGLGGGLVPPPGSPGSYFGSHFYGRHYTGKKYFG